MSRFQVLVGVAVLLGGMSQVWAGPPAVCHPIQIGDSQSLPFGKDAFAKISKFPLHQVAPSTLKILAGSDDTLLHMETIRRAVIYLQQDRKMGQDFLAMLQKHAAGAGKEISREKRGLLWFDLGYAQGAFRQYSRKRYSVAGDTVVANLEKAVSLRPQDGALYLGAALASWGIQRGIQYRFLDRALQLSDDPCTLLRENLLSIGKHFMGAETHEQLQAKVREQLGQA